MEKITLSRTKRIQINDGPDYIEFTPGDAAFADRFYAIYGEIEAKQAEFAARSAELDAGKKQVDARGIPLNLGEGLAFLKETCLYLREKIDFLFGPGTSQKLFGDALSLELIGEFFEAITPFIQTARSEKLAQYAKQGKRVLK